MEKKEKYEEVIMRLHRTIIAAEEAEKGIATYEELLSCIYFECKDIIWIIKN